MSKHSELIRKISSMISEAKEGPIELNGVKGRTFFLSNEVTIKSLFFKDGIAYANVEGDYKTERRLDDFTYETIIAVNESLS